MARGRAPIPMRPVSAPRPESAPKPPQMKAVEVAVVGAGRTEVAGIEVGKQGKDVVERRKAGGSFEDTMREAQRRKISRIDTEQSTDHQTRFEPSQQARLTHAENAINDLSSYTQITQKLGEMGVTTQNWRTNASGPDRLRMIEAAKAVDPTLATLSDPEVAKRVREMRSRALSQITQLDVFKNLFPDATSLSPDIQKEFADVVFASSADFQSAVATRLEQWQQRVKGLKPVSEAGGTGPSEPADRALQRINTELGLTGTDAIKIDAVAEQFRDGLSVDEVGDKIVTKLAGQQSASIKNNPTGIAAIVSSQRRHARLAHDISINQNAIAALDAEAGTTGITPTRLAKVEADRSRLIVEKSRLTTEQTTLQATVDQQKNDYGATADDDSAIFRKIQDSVQGVDDGTGTKIGGIKGELERAQKAIGKKSAETAKSTDASSAEQGSEREALLSELEGMLNDSLVDTMQERNQFITEDVRRQATVDADAARDRGEFNTEAAIRRLGKAPTETYRPIDKKGKRHADRDALSADFDRLSGGPEGLERIFIRTLSSGENPVIDFDTMFPEGDARSAAINGLVANGIRLDKIDATKAWEQAKGQLWKVIDLESFAVTPDGKLLKQMIDTQGAGFKKQFFSEFLTAQTMADRAGVGKLSRNSGEWREMYRHYESDLVSGWENHDDLKNFRQNLEDQGVDIKNLGGFAALMMMLAGRGNSSSDDSSDVGRRAA